MSATVLGQIFAAVAGLVTVLVSIWTEKRAQRREADDAIARRDREELRAGMARIDRLRIGAESVSTGSPPELGLRGDGGGHDDRAGV